MARIISSATQLAVFDVQSSLDFYQKIGFSVLNVLEVEGRKVYGMVERDQFQIHFIETKKEKLHFNEELNSLACDLILWIPEIEEFYNEIVSLGIEITEPLTKRMYGSTEFSFKDSDGHKILIGD
ncbi:MAG: VOC family protein [Chryseobacterium sp.]|jgi:uncharacterized glyoxalase superfamily protein PhnB|uniref:VOC family protein n=1 Tax=Chryseobacterium sp. TaxID=1871047 RepID=UPI00282F2219|nr:VOC family protein [Chryseobacterium sp.]MDR2235965.1 VOC family protein [Chryseobacterium sp.]